MGNEFKAGDVVQLKSGSTPLTVIKVYKEGEILYCSYWHKEANELRYLENLDAITFKHHTKE